ncbi:MAG: alpha-galactosidase [Phycisphaerae bacterium]|nr:alpha-galactosidase [Phycisphaerae bacterium]
MIRAGTAVTLLLVAGMEAWAMLDTDIPMEAFDDAVMAGSDEVQAMQDWVASWAGKPVAGLPFRSHPPFSFVYGGKPFADLLKDWKRTAETKELSDRVEHRIRWSDPQTGLQVTMVAGAFKRFPAADWVVYFENRGQKDTPIIENIQALNLSFGDNDPKQGVVLHHLNGDTAKENAFQPEESAIEPGKSVRMAPNGGRPACTSAFPFFNLQYGGEGTIIAVGWTGQWAATLDRSAGGSTRITAGMERTRLLLHPGERIRTPRILMMPWKSNRQAAHNRWRRLLLFHYVPRLDGRPVRLPVALQTYDRYNARPGWATEKGQIEYARFAHEIGADTVWLDAAWFPGNFPNGVGNWFCKPAEFPNGLKPVSDECHRLGMRFMLWFEPERVGLDTQIAKEHMDFVFKGEHNHLFRLNDPKARRWLTDLLLQRIGEYGLDIYRNDFNIAPLDSWRKYDEPNREGMNEIRYVEGLYEMWDELRANNPKLLIDNCAGGGRRIDLEMCMRSVPLWRSDSGCSPGHIDWNHMQTCALSQYIPLHTVATWSPDPYETRSAATAGGILEWGYLEEGFPVPLAKATVAEVKENQKYWYGDFYPLTPVGITPGEFVAWQLHRPDLDTGLVLAFRRAQCGNGRLKVALAAVKADAKYSVEVINDARQKESQTMTGTQLSSLELEIDHKPGSLIVRYAPAK